ncbi:hypothetical protein ABPG75_009507 [Micractinium tetrahymenae]
MRLLERVLTPRGAGGKRPELPVLALPEAGRAEPASPFADENCIPSQTPRSKASRLSKLLSGASRVLTPRRRGSNADGSLALQAALVSPRPCSAGAGDAQRTTPTLRRAPAGLAEAQLRLANSPAPSTTPAGDAATHAGAGDSDTASEADSDLSSLDGFGDYARIHSLGADGEGSCSGASHPDQLPSPRQLTAAVQNCTPRHSARDGQRAAEDLQRFLQTGELPGSQQRLARLLAHADAQGPDTFADVPLHCLGYERCSAALLQLLLPLPPSCRTHTLAHLQSKLSAQLLSHLGSSLERVLESERGCQRLCRLPFPVVQWLLQHAPADRGETLFDLANLWIEQHAQRGAAPASEAQQAALAALVWRRPLAADFLRCMEANLPWAADFVAGCGARPAHLPPSLDGRFSFTAEFELHDLLELHQAAVAAGRPQQQQSPAMYCGGYCWWAVLVANPQHNRFELYASCAPFSLFLEPFRAALQPAADVRFSFQGNTSLVDWRQSNDERLAAFHTHWGGPAFFVPAGCPSLLAGSRSSGSLGRTASGGMGGRISSPVAGGPAPPLAAAVRPDTARGPRPTPPSRQTSRLSISSSASAEAAAASAAAGLAGTPTSALASRRSAHSGPGTPTGALASSRSSLGSGQKQGDLQGSSTCGTGYEADSGAITARHVRPSAAGLSQLSMEGLIAEVRRSCPYAWGASLRVRLSIRLLGGS